MILLGDWAPGCVRCHTHLPGSCALVNLEGPVLPADHGHTPAPKAGPSLFSTTPPRTAGQLVCSLANNHTMDFGEAGLATTRATLRESGALTVGAGATQAASRAPLVVTDGGARVAIVACAEAQFGSAQPYRPGIAVLGPWVYDAIRACRTHADAVVVSVHAGAELSPWPAPALQDLYHSWVDAGAAIIHGHHPHVPQGFEAYHGGLILYGLGNLAVSPRDWHTYPNALWSLAADVDFAARPLRWRMLAFSVEGDEREVRIKAHPASDHAPYRHDCQRALADRGLLEALWQEVALRAYRQYYRGWLRFPDDRPAPDPKPHGDPLAALRRSWRARAGGQSRPKIAARQDHLLWHVLFACLTHENLIATALGVLSGEITDLRTPETRALTDRWMPWSVSQAEPAEATA